MREIIMNGEPKVYHSEYAPKDINNFMIDVVCQAYKETGVSLEVIDKGSYTQKKSLFGRAKKNEFLPPVLRHSHCLGEGSFDCDYILYESHYDDDINIEGLIKAYSKEGRHLKIVRVYISPVHDDNDSDGYRIQMDSHTIFPIQSNNELPELLSSDKVAEVVKTSYEKLDACLMEPYLDCNVTYQSFVVFNEITSREEYLAYIKGKFRVWKEYGTYPEITISKEGTDDTYVLHFNNMITDGTVPTLYVSIKEGRVVSFYMSARVPPVDTLLPLLKEKPGRLDNDSIWEATNNAFESYERTFLQEECDFHWLQHLAMQPCNQHMCFSYKSIVLSVYVAPVKGDVIYVSREELDYYEQFRKENHLTTVLLPVWLDTLKPIKDGLLLDPNTLKPMDLEKTNDENDIYFMTPWEANAMAWFNTHFYLAYNGCRIDQATNVPDCYPQIVATTKEGRQFFCIVNALPIGNEKKDLTLNIMMAEQCRTIDGFFVNMVYSNNYNTLDFNETELLRVGGQWSSNIELVPLSEVSSRYPNIHLNISYFKADE